EVYPSPGPAVSNNITIENTTNATHTYLATVVLPIPAAAYDSVINSSVGVTFTDGGSGAGDNSLLLQENGGAMDQGQINGSTVLPLNLGPYTTADCSPNPSTAGCSGTKTNNPPSQPAGPGTATSIAIALRFSLSPHDSVSFTDRLQIAPEPLTGA